jgi:hypothetical protein
MAYPNLKDRSLWASVWMRPFSSSAVIAGISINSISAAQIERPYFGQNPRMLYSFN